MFLEIMHYSMQLFLTFRVLFCFDSTRNPMSTKEPPYGGAEAAGGSDSILLLISNMEICSDPGQNEEK
jgi:hypothetical protein